MKRTAAFALAALLAAQLAALVGLRVLLPVPTLVRIPKLLGSNGLRVLRLMLVIARFLVLLVVHPLVRVLALLQ